MSDHFTHCFTKRLGAITFVTVSSIFPLCYLQVSLVDTYYFPLLAFLFEEDVPCPLFRLATIHLLLRDHAHSSVLNNNIFNLSISKLFVLQPENIQSSHLLFTFTKILDSELTTIISS